MFRWTDDMIRYMADAGRRTDFHRRLTAELLPYLSPQDRVCDAGCGLGFLSLALAPHVRHVTAADCDAQALSVLKGELATRHIENVTPLCTDIFTDRPAEPYDAMVFCFFGSWTKYCPWPDPSAAARSSPSSATIGTIVLP